MNSGAIDINSKIIKKRFRSFTIVSPLSISKHSIPYHPKIVYLFYVIIYLSKEKGEQV